MALEPSFEWDNAKARLNRAKHGVSFALAQAAFFDPYRVIAEDLEHSGGEPRYLLRRGRRRRDDGALHLSRGTYPNLRGRLLAERKTNL
jgi:ribonuclease toxin BrnT of type II toxin-antitoxin system